MTINDTFLEIKSITSKLIETGLSIREKFPLKIGNQISWSGQNDLSVALKSMPYDEKYSLMMSNENFNIKMVDGALIQFMYEFSANGRDIKSHRLAYFPAPFIERYDDVPDDYENHRHGNSEFHDLIEKHIVSFPVRFDYNSSMDFYREIDHPFSHVTLGEYKNCRIPVSAPVTPSMFINFIVHNFYTFAVHHKGVKIPISEFRFQNCISGNENFVLHLNICKEVKVADKAYSSKKKKKRKK